MAKLKPCPFCGRIPVKTQLPHNWVITHKKGCWLGNPHREHIVVLSDRFGLDKDWNRRAKEAKDAGK